MTPFLRPLNAGAIRCFNKLPAHLRKTLTLDNGSEFIEHQTLGHRLGFTTYFANPYASWERGTNENTNGLIRQYLPKGGGEDGVTSAWRDWVRPR